MAENKKTLKNLLRPYRLRLSFLSLLMILQSFLQVAMALLMRSVIDAAIYGNGRLLFWAILLATDILLQVGIYALLSWYTSSTVDRMSASLRTRLLRSAVYSVDVHLQEFHSGALLSRGMEDVHTVCDGVVQALPALLGQITRLAAAFGAIVLIHPPAALVLLIAGVAVVGAVSLLRPVLKARQRAVRESEEKVMSTMQEDLQQLELIQSLQSQERVVDRFRQRQHISLKQKFKRRIWSVSSNSILSVASLLGTGLLLLWGADRVAKELLTYGALTSMLQLLNQFRGPVLSLSGLWTRFTAVEVAAERLMPLLEIPEQPERTPVEKPSAVVFENVTFRYPGDELAVVENFSMTLPLEGWVSLSGISGLGKTTLFKLILGLYQPQEGRVYLRTEQGDVPCSAATRHLFAYVPQDYALFSGTVRENLCLVAPDADAEMLAHALKVAAAEFVQELPAGLNTHLGENNTGLSKGQLQRIAIARAVLMERKILLLDECTSALDADTESCALRNLYRCCPNALLVTHRPQALEQLEQITSVTM